MEKKVYKRGIRIFLFALLFVFLPFFARAATMSISPANGTFSVGDRVTLKIVVSGDVPLNAVSGLVSIPSSFFSIESISKSGSIISFWVTDPSFSRADSTVHFEGVALTPFQGNNGVILNVTLKALKPGTANISYVEGQILANDGEGTDITGNLNKGTYTINPAKVPVKPTPTPTPTPEPIPEVITPTIVDLLEPNISLGKQDGLLSILGKSNYPKADVVLTFISVGGSKVFINGTTDNSGEFSLIVPQALKNGPYSVSGVLAVDGRQSPPSNILTIQIGGVFYFGISWETTTYIGIFLILIMWLIILFLLWRRYSTTHEKSIAQIKKEVSEANEALHRSFGVIKDDVYTSIRSSMLAGGDESMSGMNKLKDDLDTSEKSVKKEIDDIGEVPVKDD